MKTTIKTKLVIGTLAVTLGAASLIPMAGHAMRVEALDATWGKPLKVETLANSSEIRYYCIEEAGNPCSCEFDRSRVFEVQKDGQVIDQGFFNGVLENRGQEKCAIKGETIAKIVHIFKP